MCRCAQIIINMLTGPSLFKSAIVALGEAGRPGSATGDAHTVSTDAIDEETGLQQQQPAQPSSPTKRTIREPL